MYAYCNIHGVSTGPIEAGRSRQSRCLGFPKDTTNSSNEPENEEQTSHRPPLFRSLLSGGSPYFVRHAGERAVAGNPAR